VGAGKMILQAKIDSKYLDDILSGKKTQEFRQFTGNDYMMVVDETGRKAQLRIKRMAEACPALEKGIKEVHKDINWDKTEPIMVIEVEPVKQAR
jgi:hypothetical protein